MYVHVHTVHVYMHYACTVSFMYRIAGKCDEQNIWWFAPPKVLGGFKFGDGQETWVCRNTCNPIGSPSVVMASYYAPECVVIHNSECRRSRKNSCLQTITAATCCALTSRELNGLKVVNLT